MGSIWLHDIDDVLAPLVGDGIPKLIEEPGWRTRARGSGGLDQFDGWMWHHTVSPPGTDGRSDVNYICYNNPYAPSPISQLYIARTGDVWILAAGAANHGGSGGPWRPGGPNIIDKDRANTRLGGTEMANRGTGEELWPWKQIYAAITVAAAISIAEGWDDTRHHLAHKEYCGPGTSTPGRKQDPLGRWVDHPDGYWPPSSGWGAKQGDIDLFRALVAKRITELTQPPEDDMEPLIKPERAMDTRPTEQHNVNPALREANKAQPLKPFAAGEKRPVVVGFCRKAEINLTVIGRGVAGWVEATGTSDRPTTSLVGFDNSDRLESNTGIVAAPNGTIWIYASAPCDVIVDVHARA